MADNHDHGGHVNYFIVFVALCVFTAISVAFDFIKFEGLDDGFDFFHGGLLADFPQRQIKERSGRPWNTLIYRFMRG